MRRAATRHRGGRLYAAASEHATPEPAEPFTVGLVDNMGRLGLTVDRLLPLHGRIVPLADLNQAAGRAY
jgi:hypothetical protein